MTKVLADELESLMAQLVGADLNLSAARSRLMALQSGPGPLPAQPPTEEQIVAALKADPAMAGRVIGELAMTLSDNGRQNLAEAAKETVSGPDMSWSYFRALQSLAVALAAASYRG